MGRAFGESLLALTRGMVTAKGSFTSSYQRHGYSKRTFYQLLLEAWLQQKDLVIGKSIGSRKIHIEQCYEPFLYQIRVRLTLPATPSCLQLTLRLVERQSSLVFFDHGNRFGKGSPQGILVSFILESRGGRIGFIHQCAFCSCCFLSVPFNARSSLISFLKGGWTLPSILFPLQQTGEGPR